MAQPLKHPQSESGQRMPDVEGQWDFYPNLRLKIKHTFSACGTFYAKSHRYKEYATTQSPKRVKKGVNL